MGPTGSGKSVYTQRCLLALDDAVYAPPIFLGFSAQTTANTTQASAPPASHYLLVLVRWPLWGPEAMSMHACMHDDEQPCQPCMCGTDRH